MMQPIFTGVATALVTPFNKEQVDFSALEFLIERQIKMGVNALVILGTTGEICTLTDSERRAIIDCAIKVNHNRVPLIFGIGGNNPVSIIQLGNYIAKKTDNANRLAVMVTAPYYNKGTQEGIYTFYQKITNAIKLPTIVYNIPSRTGVNIKPETLAQIAKLKYVVGIKEASGDINQIIQTVKQCPKVAVYSGDDTIALAAYAVGCRGIISVASNINVAPVQNIFDYYRTGEITRALTLFQEQLPLYQSLFRAVNPIPIKYELAQLGLIKNALRLPLTPIK